MEISQLFVACLILTFSAFSQEKVNKTDPNGMKEGKWESRYPDGTLRYEGYFVHNKPAGDWKRYHKNGKVKALMNYRPNSEAVFASLFDDEGKLYAKGLFEGTLRDSTWNFYSGDQLVQTENYSHGKKEGKATGYNAEGKLIWEKYWKNDLLDGRSLEYYPDGTKRSEITCQMGKRSGPAIFYRENGLKSMEGNFLDDSSDGVWKIFDTDGKLKYQIKYNKGEILDGGKLDTLQLNEFKQYDRMKGKIPEPKMNESGRP